MTIFGTEVPTKLNPTPPVNIYALLPPYTYYKINHHPPGSTVGPSHFHRTLFLPNYGRLIYGSTELKTSESQQPTYVGSESLATTNLLPIQNWLMAI
jgi:hypothetical protein